MENSVGTAILDRFRENAIAVTVVDDDKVVISVT